ncbi:MAG: CRISPR-associated endonuclease Cas1 [Bacteroidota bacterium]
MSKKTFNKLCESATLSEAWLHVAERGARGGIDGTSVKAFAARANQYLQALAEDLKSGNYIPEPYLSVKVDKRSGGKRELGLPSVRDKIVQQAVKLLIEPKLDLHFLDVSYAYRKHKSTYKAVQRVRHIIRTEKKNWVVKGDIYKYFDHINHKILLDSLKNFGIESAIIHLIELWLGMAKVGHDLVWKPSKKGIPQGSNISPLLSNLYLHPLDQLMVKEGYGFVRYADDFLILCRNKYEAEKAHTLQATFLKEELKLSLNAQARSIQLAEEGLDFLGIRLLGSEVSLSKEKLERLKETLARGLYLKGIRINSQYFGKLKTMMAYYGKLLPQEMLEELDNRLSEVLIEAIRNWLRKRQVKIESVNQRLLQGLPFFSTSFRQARNKHIQAILKQGKIRPRAPRPDHQETKIAKKQKEYEQRAADARELLVSSPGAFIGKAYGQIVVRRQGVGIQRLPIKPLKNITIQSRGVSISSDVLYLCSQQGISIDFLGFDGKPFGKFSSNRPLSAKTGIAQLEAYQNGKGWQLAKTFVLGKIRNQLNLIKYANKYDAESNKAYRAWGKKTITDMEQQLLLIQGMKEGILEEKRMELMGAEARAALLYWQFVKRYLSAYVDFPGREQQGALDPTNHALNYGYGILYGRIWESLVKARLHTSLSYLHSPAEATRPSLVFDLIEEFRTQAVDRPVYGLIRRSAIPQLKEGRLVEASRKRIVKVVLQRLSKKEKFRKRSLSLSEIIMFQGRSLASYIEGQLPRYRPYIRKW